MPARAAESGQSSRACLRPQSSSRASHCLHSGHQSIGELNMGVTFRSYLGTGYRDRAANS